MSRDFLHQPLTKTDQERKPISSTDVDGDKRAIDVFIRGTVGEEEGGAGFTKSTIIIPASSMLVVDTNLLVSFTRLEYILNFKDDPITVTKSLRLIGQNNGGVVTDTVSERLGGPINVLVDLTDDSVDAFLEITNNEVFDLTLTMLKNKI